MAEYERLLPSIFAGAVRIELRDRQGKLVWSIRPGTAKNEPDYDDSHDDPDAGWSDFGANIERRQLPCKQLQFRTTLSMRQHGDVACLIATYDLIRTRVWT